MDAAGFERAYAERSGVSVEELRALGRVIVPCACGDALCEGWQSVNRRSVLQDAFLHADADGTAAGTFEQALARAVREYASHGLPAPKLKVIVEAEFDGGVERFEAAVQQSP
jgi:hypothetical protein